MGTCSPAHHSRWSKNWHLPGKSLPFPPATLAPGGRTDKVDGHGPKESASGGPQQLTPSVKAGVQDSGGPGLEPEGEGAVRGAELFHLFPTSLADHAQGRADPTRVDAAVSAAGP